MTRVALISDTHLPRGSRTLPPRCEELCAGADLLLHCGDVCTLGVWRTLEALGPPALGVHGNTDEAELAAALPGKRVVEVGAARIGMIHDAGPATKRAARLRELFPACAAVAYGHSHVPEMSLEGGVWILNPGSPTERRRSPRHTMLLLDVEQGAIRPQLVEL